MPDFSEVEFALDQQIEPLQFESLCVELLSREGYHTIIPGGRTRDHGRDAEVRYWTGEGEARISLAFQFSLEERWERKLKRDLTTIRKYCEDAESVVFVSSRNITNEKKDKLRAHARSLHDLGLVIYDRGWLRFKLEERHQDLAEKRLGIRPPPTIGHVGVLIELHGLNDESAKEIFGEESPQSVKATLTERVRHDPDDWRAWKSLAYVEDHLRNYDDALNAASRALALKSDDINLRLLKGSILAESGIERDSKVRLSQAAEVFEWAVQKLGRSVDFYNLANVLGAMGDLEGAEANYRRTLKLEPEYAQAWKNLGSILFKTQRHEEELACYDKAIAINPELPEAYLSKANTLLSVRDDVAAALECHQLARKVDPDVDRKWSHARYWFAVALTKGGQQTKALDEVEAGLETAPDDPHLLNLKATLLSTLWRSDSSFENAALKYFEFRAGAIPNDFAGLVELIDLCTAIDEPERAWKHIDRNLDTSPFSVKEAAAAAGLSMNDLRIGFESYQPYRPFRSFLPVRDYLIQLREHGLSPDPTIEPELAYLLMAPYGKMLVEFPVATKSGNEGADSKVFGESVEMSARIISSCGVRWLSCKTPTDRQDQIERLAKGIAFLFEVIIAESSRQLGENLGRMGLDPESAPGIDAIDLESIRGIVVDHLMKDADDKWKMFSLAS